MVLVYRCEKNAPLTPQELDGNFQDLDKRLQYLEKKMEKGGLLQDIKVDNNRLLFLSDQGTVMAEVPIPSVQFNARGTWAPQTYYQKFDAVAVTGQTLLCTENHYSSADLKTDVAEKKWQLFIDVLTLLQGK